MDRDYQARRRQQYRARQRRRRRLNLLLLLLAFVLVGVLVLCLTMCGRDGQGGEDVPAGDQVTDLPQSGDDFTGSDTNDDETASQIDKDVWNLILLNRWNPLPDGYALELATLPNGLEVDERCYDDLMDMLDALYAQGLTPVICSAYRSVDLQQTLYDNMVDEYLWQGYSRSEAEDLASREVAIPGTSEHHLGLAVDIVDVNYQILDEGQEDTAVQRWLMENSWRYGFILRYPSDKTDITGIIYEPWHYRYVGMEYAEEIYRSGLCFEEWLEQA